MKLRITHIGILSAWVLLCCLLQVNAQVENTYRFLTYSNREGFNQNTVKAIEEDKTGTLWLGASNGLIRYDGYSFENLSWEPNHIQDVYHGPISSICSDSKGLLWIVASSGLNLYCPDKERFFKVTSDSLDMLYRTIEGRDGSMWVVGNGYLSNVKAALAEDSIVSDWSPNLLTGTHSDLDILDLLELDENRFLLATSTGLYNMSLTDSPIEVTIEREDLFPASSISRIVQYNNMIWIGTQEGLYKTVLDGNKLLLIKKYVHENQNEESLSHNHVTDILMDSQNRMWIGTWLGGLSLHNGDEETFTNFTHDPRKKSGISGNMIICLYEDPFNVLWIGTAQAGLCKLDLNQKQFTNLEHNPYDVFTIPANLINNVLEDSEGYLWISTYNLPLCRSTEPVDETNLSRLKFFRFDRWFSTFPDKNIVSLYEDKHGNIWLGYENEGVVVYNKRTNHFSRVEFELNDQALPVRLSRHIGPLDQDKLMVTGSRIIVLKDPWRYLNQQNVVTIPVYSSYSFDDTRLITAVYVENREKIWIGFRDNGLSMFSMAGESLHLIKNHEQVEDDKSSISNNSVFCLLNDQDQNLWIGTFGGGLNRLNQQAGSMEKGFERLRDTLGMADNAIYGMIQENDSMLWCGTDMGISVLNTRTLQTTNYNMFDGLPNNNLRQNAYHEGRSGFYYFGGLYGLTAFKPEQIKANRVPPVVKLTNLKINNRIVSAGETVGNRILLDTDISEVEELVLNRENRTVSIDITAYHTAIPEKNRLSYILEGFDKEWIHVNQGSFSPTYTNLTPGVYTFRVRGYNCDGIISEGETSLHITMLAPWFARTSSKLLFAVLGLSLIFGISFYVVKLKNLQNKLHFEQLDKERIKEVNQSKLRFFTNISHEFKTPLSLISIPLQKLKELIQGEEETEYVEMIEKNSSRLIRLIDQLLTFRRIEHGGLKLKISQSSLDGFIYPVADAFESLSLKKGIQFYYQVKDPAHKIHLDLEKMEQVLFNLLSNAFKFTPPNGTVRLEGCIREENDKKYACFDVTDNGVGIHTDDLSKIFERFYQSGSELRNMGTGIGLSYSKSIVELHKGFIRVESTPGERTCFSVLLPLNELKTDDIEKNKIRRLNAIELLEYENIASNLVADPDSENYRKPCVLIADDESEFRSIIKNVLQKDYRILEASNGKDALDLASSRDVDLIISDVMMPGLNGYEFCKKVKTDMQLCHIPFVLLTALEEMDSHIQGMEHGADSYMSKPFNLKYLEVTVQKLIENREKLKAHFTQSSSLPADVQISGIDTEFIELVNEAIQKNLDNSSFGVEELAREANLSTSQLYRKMKLLTGQIPNAYLRNYRLQAAADLLAGNPGISVKSVMYEVGIESASHFSHAFKKKFGYSPSEFS
jgi:signal transduction histidine kinase/ligand-binding sensor domain-containing protein/CheY-like chemotaxis protein